jgi:1,2-phenylacetyl-CoA epoxidase PaaB subunit
MSAARLSASAAGEVYEVFAKIKPEDPLHHVGNVIAPDARLAQVYAFTTYQEWAWAEMIIAPRSAIVAVIEIV